VSATFFFLFLRPDERVARLPQNPLSPPTIPSQHRTRRAPPPLNAINIDRRAHLEAAWRRQAEEEAALAALSGGVLRSAGEAGPGPGSAASSSASAAAAPALDPAALHTVRSAAHLDALAAAAGGATVIAVVFYSRSCGTCKAWLAGARACAAEAGAARSGVLFAAHDVRDAWDDATDLARLHRVRAVPTVLFFSGGASVRRLAAPDSRALAPKAHARGVGGGDWARARLRAAVDEVVFRETPSARRG
jgi:hypothetical protein